MYLKMISLALAGTALAAAPSLAGPKSQGQGATQGAPASGNVNAGAGATINAPAGGDVGVQTRGAARTNSQGAANASATGAANANANSALNTAPVTGGLTGVTSGMMVKGSSGAELGTVSKVVTNGQGVIVRVLVKDETGGTISVAPGKVTVNADGTLTVSGK